MTQQTPGVPSGPHDDEYFGQSIGVGDVTGDGKADVVVGTPGQDVGKVTQGGTVTVLRGSRTGLTGAGASVLSRSTAGVPGSAGRRAAFGIAVAVVNLDGIGPADIVVGELPPEAEFGSITGPWGSVLEFSGTSRGPRYLTSTTGSSAAAPGLVVAIDRYGRSLPGSVQSSAF